MSKTFTLERPNNEFILGTIEGDTVQGSADHPPVVNSRHGIIRLLAGNDTIKSTTQIKIFGEISLGDGRDIITGNKLIYLLAVDYRHGNLFTGAGADTIEVRNGKLEVGEDSTLNTDSGPDRIAANMITLIGGRITTENGNDQIYARTEGIGVNTSIIQMGNGNDVLNSAGRVWIGDGDIDMGSGDDLVKTTTGFDLHYYGTIKLGPGNDQITGFATTQLPEEQTEPGLIQGGVGIDTLILPKGRYMITKSHFGSDLYSTKSIVSQISGPDSFLLVAGLNRLEGINGGGSNYDFGTFLVNEQGIGGFIN